MKTSSVLYGLALLSLPAGPALKLMFGSEKMLWVDPTLIFCAMAYVALVPSWTARDSREMTGSSAAMIALTLLCVACAISGFMIRPAAKPYDALREPMRFFLTMIWLMTSYWFLRFRRRFVFRCAAVAVALGLLAGIYIDLVALGVLPATEQVGQYARAYVLRQILWVNGMLLPRMGGFFAEAPPFGLFMLAMGVFFYLGWRSGIRGAATAIGLVLSLIGVLASLADQVLLGMLICFSAVILSTEFHRWWAKPALVLGIGAIFTVMGWQSLEGKLISGTTSDNVRHIYQNSVGERAFHIEYGLSIFVREPAAAPLGIGPGRYGEYVAETGYFPDTVTMQTTEPEILVEWGVFGLGIWAIILILVARSTWNLHGLAGVGILLGLLVADSFQSNWKSEAVFLAIAALCAPALAVKAEESKTLASRTETLEAAAE